MRIRLCWLALLVSIAGYAHAQVNMSTNVRVDAANLVMHAVEMFNKSTIRFQALRLGLEEMHPLEASSLDSNTIFENMQSLTNYQRFLEAYRQQNKVLLHRIDDSVGLLEARLGDTTRWKTIDRFYQNFKSQTSVYVVYSIHCSNYVMAIRSALVSLQMNGFDIVGGVVRIRGTSQIRDAYATQINKIQTEANAMHESYQRTLDGTKMSNDLVKHIIEELGE